MPFLNRTIIVLFSNRQVTIQYPFFKMSGFQMLSCFKGLVFRSPLYLVWHKWREVDCDWVCFAIIKIAFFVLLTPPFSFSVTPTANSSFVLGPTPAQQKKTQTVVKSPSDMGHRDMTQTHCDIGQNDETFRSKFSSLPQFQPGSSQSKLPSLPTSPQLFIQSYRKKRGSGSTVVVVGKTVSDLDNMGSDAETPNKSGTPSNGFCDSTPKSTGSTPSSTLSGQRFFGPDFNLDAFMKEGDGGEMSPFCSDGKSGPSNLRRTLDHRRQLVMQLFQERGLFPTNQATSEFQMKHSDVFPNKLCLQLKIREVRQKMMAHNQAESPSCTRVTQGGTGNTEAEVTSIPVQVVLMK